MENLIPIDKLIKTIHKTSFALDLYRNLKLSGVLKLKHITYYFKDGLSHREYGPAIINSRCKYWFKNDKLHREDGPAIECSNGDKSYYLNDIDYNKHDYNIALQEMRKKSNEKY